MLTKCYYAAPFLSACNDDYLWLRDKNAFMVVFGRKKQPKLTMTNKILV